MQRIYTKGLICSIQECELPVRSKTYCSSHYNNLVRNVSQKCSIVDCKQRRISKTETLCRTHKANPSSSPKISKSKIANMDDLKKFVKVNDQGCWMWQGNVQYGYGKIWTFYKGSRHTSAHRLSYVIANGELEPGMQVHHNCAVKQCVNPDHLQAVTQESNTAEMWDRNRMLKRLGMKDIEIEKLVEEIAYLKEKNSEQSAMIAILKDLLTKELTR